MRARFFNAATGFVTGFMAGCIAAENSLDENAWLRPITGSQFQFIPSLFVAKYVWEEFTRGDITEAYVSNNIGFLLGYEYTIRNAQAAELEGTLPRWWRSGPK